MDDDVHVFSLHCCECEYVVGEHTPQDPFIKLVEDPVIHCRHVTVVDQLALMEDCVVDFTYPHKVEEDGTLKYRYGVDKLQS